MHVNKLGRGQKQEVGHARSSGAHPWPSILSSLQVTTLHLFLSLLPLSSTVLSFLAAVFVDADSDLVIAAASPWARSSWPPRRGRCTSDLWSTAAASSSLPVAVSLETASTEARSGGVTLWLPPAPVVLSCSTNRSCTMVRNGIRSLFIA